ncbi:MAG: hypothetical protein Ta2B_12480 [Termitinemataceae bacterium]|nr:MAG: hypothetical protein Ta2B_12480 [Termitinemataceae bacterium]
MAMRRYYLQKRGGIYYAELLDTKTGLKLTARSTGTNKNPRRRAAGYFCSPGELHFGFNTPCYAAEPRTRNAPCAECIKPYGSNKKIYRQSLKNFL